MVQLSFKQTKAEYMVRVASTLLFNQLVKANSRIVSVREITENVQYGYTEKADESEIGPKYVRITDLKDGRVNWDTVPYCKCDEPESYLLKQNDLIFARTGATTGKTHLFRDVPPYAVFASYLIRVRPTKEINPEYLYYFFQSDLYWSQVSSHKEGSAQPNVNGQKLSVIELPITTEEIQNAVCKFLAVVRARQDGFNQELPELPQPLTEQRRIVAHIESLAARVNEAQRLREEAENETEALFTSAVSNLPFDEKHWTNVDFALSKHKGAIHSGPFGSDLTHDEFVESGVAAIGTRDVQVNKFSLGSGWYVTPERFERLKQYQIFPNDVLVTIIGGSIGRFCVVPENAPLAFTTKHVIAMQFNPLIAEPRYMSYMLNFHRKCRETMFSQTAGSAQPSLNITKIRAIEIPVPPLDEQRRIVAYLDGLQAKVNALRELQVKGGEELSALMASVLDRAFKGEL